MGLDGRTVIFAANHLDSGGIGCDLHTLIGTAQGHGTAALAAEGKKTAGAGNKSQRPSIRQTKGGKQTMDQGGQCRKDHQTVEGGSQLGQTPYTGRGHLPCTEHGQQYTEGQQAALQQTGIGTWEGQRRQAQLLGEGQIAGKEGDQRCRDQTARHTHQLSAQLLDGTGRIIKGDIEKVIDQLFFLFFIIFFFDIIFFIVTGDRIGNELSLFGGFLFPFDRRFFGLRFCLCIFCADTAALEENDAAAGGLVFVKLLVVDDDVSLRLGFGFRLRAGTADGHGDRFFFSGRIYALRFLPIGLFMQLFDLGFGNQQVGQFLFGGLGFCGLSLGGYALLTLDLGDDIIERKALLLTIHFFAQKITWLYFRKLRILFT